MGATNHPVLCLYTVEYHITSYIIVKNSKNCLPTVLLWTIALCFRMSYEEKVKSKDTEIKVSFT